LQAEKTSNEIMDSYLAGRSKLSPEELAASVKETGGVDFGATDPFGGGISDSGGFKSLRDALLEAGSVVAIGDLHRGSAASQHKAEPSVEAISNGGRIEKIIVTCSCGEKVEIECNY
jgi:hypothetical protein